MKGKVHITQKKRKILSTPKKDLIKQAFGQGLSMQGKGSESTVNALLGGYSPVTKSAKDIAYERDLKNADIGTQLTVAALSAIGQVSSTMAVSLISPQAAMALMGTGVFGNSFDEAITEGKGREEAYEYATVTALSEVALSKFLGVFEHTGGALKQAISGVAKKPSTKGLMALLKSSLGEGTEEYLQEVLNPAFRNTMLDENNDIKAYTTEAAMAGILGFLTAGLFNAGSFALTRNISTKEPDTEIVEDITQDMSTEEMYYYINGLELANEGIALRQKELTRQMNEQYLKQVEEQVNTPQIEEEYSDEIQDALKTKNTIDKALNKNKTNQRIDEAEQNVQIDINANKMKDFVKNLKPQTTVQEPQTVEDAQEIAQTMQKNQTQGEEPSNNKAYASKKIKEVEKKRIF